MSMPSSDTVITALHYLEADCLHEQTRDPHVDSLRTLVEQGTPWEEWPENTKLLVKLTLEDLLPRESAPYFD